MLELNLIIRKCVLFLVKNYKMIQIYFSATRKNKERNLEGKEVERKEKNKVKIEIKIEKAKIEIEEVKIENEEENKQERYNKIRINDQN